MPTVATSEQATHTSWIAAVSQTLESLIGLSSIDLPFGDGGRKSLPGVTELNGGQRRGSLGFVVRGADSSSFLGRDPAQGDHPVETGLEMCRVVGEVMGHGTRCVRRRAV